jgi:hypothetical protein
VTDDLDWTVVAKAPRYLVSPEGLVKNRRTGRLKVIEHGERGRTKVTLQIADSKPKTFNVSRLVAEAFLSDFKEELSVEYISGDRGDNRVDNLRMGTRKKGGG